MSSTPALGRVVLMFVEPLLNNGSDVAPATIVRVWSDSMVNLKVRLDSGNADLWKTSVPLFDTREQAEASASGRVDGGAPYAAYWPPRV
jgi:hypothetical protein